MNAVAHDVKIRRRNADRQSYRRGVTPLVLMVAVGGLWVGLLGRLRRRRNDDGPRWYQLVYRLIYRLGFIVWNRAKPPAELVALVEGPPRGRRVARWISAAAPAPIPSAWPPTTGMSPASI
jgi:hypothetical protein